MSIVTTDNRFYSEIAAAIRQKNGESTLYLPADMAEAILAIKGGGDAFAAISVTYPEGSVCTCTQLGQTPLTAGDTSGAWLFVVPAGGVWRIQSQNSSTDKSAFRDVEVAQYSLISVELVYSYHVFAENEGLVNGFSLKLSKPSAKTLAHSDLPYTSGAASVTSARISFTATNTGNTYSTLQSIDVTNYSKMCVELKCLGRYSSSYTITIGVGQNNTISEQSVGTLIAETSGIYSTDRAVYEADISAINEPVYLKIKSYAVTHEIYNIWLE